jgi:RHS repeat-associated protein
MDVSTGNVYLRARWYAPGQGRFLTKDVLEGDYEMPMSYNAWLYGYANPIRFMDPSGLVPTGQIFNEKVSPPGVTWIPSSDPLSSGAGGIPYGKDQAQFNIRPNWTGLCGPISVAAIIRSKDPTITAQEIVNEAEDMFGDPNNLGAGQIERLLEGFISATYKNNWNVEWGYITKWVIQPPYIWQKGGEQRVASQMKEWMITSNLIIAGVMAGSNSGRILEDGIGHWIVITGMSMYWEDNPWNERNWVRIYNPFDNETEYYPWDYFRKSWRNNGSMLVLVKPTQLPIRRKICGR